MSLVSYTVDSETFSQQVKVAEAMGKDDVGVEMADPNDPYQVGSPSSGDCGSGTSSPAIWSRKARNCSTSPS